MLSGYIWSFALGGLRIGHHHPLMERLSRRGQAGVSSISNPGKDSFQTVELIAVGRPESMALEPPTCPCRAILRLGLSAA